MRTPAAARAKNPKPNPDRFTRVRDRELLDLVQQLEDVERNGGGAP